MKKVKKLLQGKRYDIVTLSNPFMTVNQIIIKTVKCSEIIWVEDGLMNYYNYVSKNKRLKSFFNHLLGINELKFFNNIKKTYLLYPAAAKMYYGKKVSLIPIKHLDNGISQNTVRNLTRKKIFVGQSIYTSQYNILSLSEYNRIVNEIIKEYKIDYYWPHPFSSPEENIECKSLPTEGLNFTLEMLASKTDFEIFSFNSSVLFSTKLINPMCKSHVVIPWILRDSLRIPEILHMTCDIIQGD